MPPPVEPAELPETVELISVSVEVLTFIKTAPPTLVAELKTIEVFLITTLPPSNLIAPPFDAPHPQIDESFIVTVPIVAICIQPPSWPTGALPLLIEAEFTVKFPLVTLNTLAVNEPVITTERAVVPSMVISDAIGSSVCNAMKNAPPLNTIVSAPAALLASTMACRSDPAPASACEVTVNVAACVLNAATIANNNVATVVIAVRHTFPSCKYTSSCTLAVVSANDVVVFFIVSSNYFAAEELCIIAVQIVERRQLVFLQTTSKISYVTMEVTIIAAFLPFIPIN
jgi:hypothetical protein